MAGSRGGEVNMQRPARAWFRLLALSFAAIQVAPTSATAQAPPAGSAATEPRDLASRVEEYMAARVKRDHFSGSVLIARDGKVLFSRGYGMANLELDVPNTPRTKFRLGSITKQFTAAAILVLQQQGKLSVQDRIRKHLPDAPKAWDEITIHHLLTHTSGIPNYTSYPEFLKTLPVPVTLKELIAKFRDKPLDFKPGEKFRYSNSGYVVLGQIIENVAGQSYASFLQAAVLGPAGMKDTGYDSAVAIVKHRASGYTRRLGILLTNSDYVDMSIPHAAGALYSTVEDLLKWDQALYTDRPLDAKSREAMFTPFKDHYGYGWVIDRKFGRPRYSHGGGIMGFVTIIERYPDDRLLVVALCNLENSPVGPVGDDLPAIALGKKYVVPREPVAAKLDPAVLDGYTGRYQVEPSGNGKPKDEEITTISRDGARLFSQTKGQPRYVLTPESDMLFYARGADTEVRFVRDPMSRKVTGLGFLRDGEERTARKLPPEAGAGGKK
jgi:CubicO group peptidase (beta-lactamase class C family)